MLCSETIAVCSQIHTKHINTLCGQNAELLNVKLAEHKVTTKKPQLNVYPPYKKLSVVSHVVQTSLRTARCVCTGHYFIWQISFLIYCASRVGGRRSGLRQTADRLQSRMGQNISISSKGSIQFPIRSEPSTLSPRIKWLGRETNHSSPLTE